MKAYLRYEPTGAFGVISSGANVVYDNCGRFLITPALESALVWNVKQGVQVGERLHTRLPRSGSNGGCSCCGGGGGMRLKRGHGGLGSRQKQGYFTACHWYPRLPRLPPQRL